MADDKTVPAYPQAAPDAPPNDMHQVIAAWFLGPQAENSGILLDRFRDALSAHFIARQTFHKEDGKFITDSLKNSQRFKDTVENTAITARKLLDKLNRYSVPFFSPRYVGHMCFETSMPAIVGTLATVLLNPNNVAFEASPWTTQVELFVGKDMCRMMGYDVTGMTGPKAWGHIACDGTVANLESIWAARNLKFYPLSLREAMEPGQPLHFISDHFRVPPCAFDRANRAATESALFSELRVWDLLNLRVEDILNIPERLQAQFNISPSWLEHVLKPFLVQTRGKDALEKEWRFATPQYLISSTKHYSWPKGAAIAGLGSENMVDISVDNNGRVDIRQLRNVLQQRFDRKQAVYAVVAVIGSTEEGAVDPLCDIVELRNEFQAKGMSFVLHVDAAWGGYFASMLPDDKYEGGRDFVPVLSLSEYTTKQFKTLEHADSITIDPHKAGYIPYPAGGLCYRDGRMRYLLTWTAPYLAQESGGEGIGIYGVEGSKPGAPAVACFMHHSVIPLNEHGHGGLLGEATFSAKRFAAYWAAMTTDNQPYLIVPFNELPSEVNGKDVAQEKAFIRDNILRKANEEIFKNQDAMEKLREIGSDLNINAFACNFRVDGKVNDDVEEANHLNDLIFTELSVTDPRQEVAGIELFLSNTTFNCGDYGECARNFKRRLGLENASHQDLRVLRNVVLSPFQTAGVFIQKIADIFERILKKHTQTLVSRNTISKQEHVFTIQGNDQLYLCYRPRFHLANARFQLILTANVTGWKAFIGHKIAGKVYTLTTKEITLQTIVEPGSSFSGIIREDGKPTGTPFELQVHLSDVKVVKMRPLNSKWRDADYAADNMPFYLYGAPDDAHIDHMLLRAPNVQLCAESVTLELKPALTAGQLAKGVLAFLAVPEAPMQPLAAEPQFFNTGRRFSSVEVYEDPRGAEDHGPGLAKVRGEPLARGDLILGGAVYVDFKKINDGMQTGRKDINECVRQMNEELEAIREAADSRFTDIMRGTAA